jgi:hypothetical protein
MKPAAVETFQTMISRETTNGLWVKAHGIPVRQGAPGEPFLTMAEYIPTLQEKNPDWWPVEADIKESKDDAAKRAELASLVELIAWAMIQKEYLK